MTVSDEIDERPEMCRGVSQERSSQTPSWMEGEKLSTRSEKENKNMVTEMKGNPQSGPQSDSSRDLK